MTGARTIAIFSGSRSEYGLLYPILRSVSVQSGLEYRLIVGAGHLDETRGATIAEIEADGFEIAAQVPMTVVDDGLAAVVRAMAMGVTGLSKIMEQMKPDFMLCYGDRYETFAAAITSTQMGIATAHVEGGDYTEGGALDDSVRHAITKLAHLHFTTNAAAAERVRRLGEEPWRVFDVGLPALDLAAEGAYAPADELVAELELDLSRPIVLFCQHSVAMQHEAAAEQIGASLAALSALTREGVQIVMTHPNPDPGGKAITEALQAFAQHAPGSVRLVRSLGRRRFHGLLHLLGRVARGAVVGNSSAGLKETPLFGCPAVNIGSRQRGRLRAVNVLDVSHDADAIAVATRRALHDVRFRELCARCDNPYGRGGAGQHIAEVLASIPLDDNLLIKRMTY